MTSPLRRGLATAFMAASLVASFGAVPATSAASSPPGYSNVLSGPIVSNAVQWDVSGPLWKLAPRVFALPNTIEHELPTRPSIALPDGAVQAAPTRTVATTGGLSFAGVGQGDYGFAVTAAPPDTNGAVGATQYVQWVNSSFAVFNKATGAIASGFPKAGNAIWSGFGGACQSNNDGDPVVRYDGAANRWILTQFSVSTTPYLQCVAVSTTSDATGSYYRYAFSYGNSDFNDYPKLSVWPDGYYITYNIFTNGQTYAGPMACALDRTAMLTGAAATQQCFQLSSAYNPLLPADLDGSIAPPAGEPNVLLSYDQASSSLKAWLFHVDWSNAANTTLAGPSTIPVAGFTEACSGGNNCIPQPSTSTRLDSLGDRLMYRLAYRRFGDGHEALLVNHSVNVGGTTSVRWYELRNASGNTLGTAAPVVYQQGTLSASDGIHRWMGSIAMDQSGDVALGYSASSSSVSPSLRYTGRVPGDPLGTMQAETTLYAGAGSQTTYRSCTLVFFCGNTALSRWGDYSAMSVDPIDNCTFWYTNEYLKSSGTFNWSTRIASFKFPGCSSAPTAPGAPNLTGATAGNAQVALAWNAPSSDGGSAITGYNVYRGTSAGAESGTPVNPSPLAANAVSYTDSTASNGTTYFYKVAAVNLIGSGTLSNERSATPVAPTAPGAPNLTGATAGNAQVALAWNAPSSDGGSAITGYNVYRGTSAGAESGTPVNPSPLAANAVSYTDSTASNGTTYFYKVAAVNLIGSGTLSNERSATPVAPTAPGAPNLTGATAGNAQVALAWNAPSSDGGSAITGYNVYRGTSAGAESGTPVNPSPLAANAVSYTDSTASNGTTYFYKVAAVNLIGSGTLSNERSATPSGASVPNAAGLTAATNPRTCTFFGIFCSGGGVKLTWTVPANNGSAITGYRIYKSTTSTVSTSGTPLTTTSSSATAYTDSSTTSGTTYYYKVVAVNAIGPGPDSNLASAKAG